MRNKNSLDRGVSLERAIFTEFKEFARNLKIKYGIMNINNLHISSGVVKENDYLSDNDSSGDFFTTDIEFTGKVKFSNGIRLCSFRQRYRENIRHKPARILKITSHIQKYEGRKRASYQRQRRKR